MFVLIPYMEFRDHTTKRDMDKYMAKQALSTYQIYHIRGRLPLE